MSKISDSEGEALLALDDARTKAKDQATDSTTDEHISEGAMLHERAEHVGGLATRCEVICQDIRCEPGADTMDAPRPDARTEDLLQDVQCVLLRLGFRLRRRAKQLADDSADAYEHPGADR